MILKRNLYIFETNKDNVDTNNEDFRQYIGDILIEVMEEQLENGTINFK